MWENKCSVIGKENKKKQNSVKRWISHGPVRTLNAGIQAELRGLPGRVAPLKAPLNKSRKTLGLKEQGGKMVLPEFQEWQLKQRSRQFME